jgi:hypothetical protein
MTFMDKVIAAQTALVDAGMIPERQDRQALVLVVEDDIELSNAIRSICECLHVAIERMPTHDDLGAALRRRHPMAIVAAMDAAGQDGCHVLKVVAAYDRDLPVLLLAENDPALLGAIDAVEEIWQLTAVTKWSQLPGVGAVVDFLFRAGRKGDCMRLMST